MTFTEKMDRFREYREMRQERIEAEDALKVIARIKPFLSDGAREQVYNKLREEIQRSQYAEESARAIWLDAIEQYDKEKAEEQS